MQTSDAPSGTPLLADLIDWSDDDGDSLSFGFTDLNPATGSGYLLMDGAVQAAGQEVVVSEEQFLNGDLLWMPGEAGEVDEVAVRASDPFGSSPAKIGRAARRERRWQYGEVLGC